jgi:hypothetical protein
MRLTPFGRLGDVYKCSPSEPRHCNGQGSHVNSLHTDNVAMICHPVSGLDL